MHNKRNDRGQQEFWNCGTNKDSRKRKRCTIGGCIPQRVLEAECAAVLGMESFDENAFLEQVDHIDVPEKKTMIFYLKDGTTVERHWISTAKRDIWTPERKAIWSEYNLAGGRKKTGMGFNEYMKWKEDSNGTDGNNDTCNTEPIHGSSD